MSRLLKLSESAPYAVKLATRELGQRIRLARKRRKMTLQQLAARAGISYQTAFAVEKGHLMTGIGAYFALIWALGLDNEMTQFMDPERDLEGKQLALAATPKRVRAKIEVASDDF